MRANNRYSSQVSLVETRFQKIVSVAGLLRAAEFKRCVN